MTYHKAFAYHGSNTSLIYDLKHAHLMHALLFLTEINYKLIVNFQHVFKKLTIKIFLIVTSPSITRGYTRATDWILF